jgi:hypothetical protein
MSQFLLAFAIIFILMLGWIIVQQWVRKFAARHPEWGNVREEGSGCGGCGCKNKNACEKNQICNKTFSNT